MRVSNDSNVDFSASAQLLVGGDVEIGELLSVQQLNIQNANVSILSANSATITGTYSVPTTNITTSWGNTGTLTASGTLTTQNFIAPAVTLPSLTVGTINVENLYQPTSSATTAIYENVNTDTLNISNETNISTVNANKVQTETMTANTFNAKTTTQGQPPPESGVYQIKAPFGVNSLDFGLGDYPDVKTYMQWRVASSLPTLIGYNLTLNAFDNGTAFGNKSAIMSLCSAQSIYKTLRFESGGNLAIYSATNTILWSSGTNVSDERIKTNIKVIDRALEKVEQLDGFYYKLVPEIDPEDTRQIGVSAQTLQTVFPEAVIEEEGVEYLRVQLERLIPLLTNATLELYDKQAELLEQLNNVPAFE